MKNRRVQSTNCRPRTCCCCRFECILMTMSGVFLISGILLCVLATTFSYPLHASCKISWTFGANCEDVNKKIVDQIHKWNNTECGPPNELHQKCRYALKSNPTPTEIKASHTTPVKHYTDSLDFKFSSDGSICIVKGSSSSDTWYAVLDYSTNYCNLHNLITGSGLDKVRGYVETTSDSVCTQYSSRNCKKY